MTVRVTVLMIDPEGEERHLWESYMHHAPTVGETLWLTNGREELEEFGTTAFAVVDVAHWVSKDISPRSHLDPLHAVAVYVEPILKADAEAEGKGDD